MHGNTYAEKVEKAKVKSKTFSKKRKKKKKENNEKKIEPFFFRSYWCGQNEQ